VVEGAACLAAAGKQKGSKQETGQDILFKVALQ
jgi:hypothetical protein